MNDATVSERDLLNDEETEAEASAAGGMSPPKGVEEARLKVRGDGAPQVLHGYRDLRRVPFEGDVDRLACAAMLDRIGDEVRDHLHDSIGVEQSLGVARRLEMDRHFRMAQTKFLDDLAATVA